MKKKILMLLLLTITILTALGGASGTEAARICSNCKAGNHTRCPNRGYTFNSTSHSIWCCCGKTFANAEMHYVNKYTNNSTYCYTCVCGYRVKHNTSGGHCSKPHCEYNSSKTLCNRGCNHTKWTSCREHSYSSTWTRTEKEHWKRCTVSSSCKSKKSLGNHEDTNGDGKCDICEYGDGMTTPTNDGGGGNAEATDPKPGAPVVNVKGTNFTETKENNIVYSNSSVSWNIETEDSISRKPLKLTEYDLSGATTGGNAVTRAGRYNREGSKAAVNSEWVSSSPSTYTFETWIYLPVYGGKNYYIFHTGNSRNSVIYVGKEGNLVLQGKDKVSRAYVLQANLKDLGFYNGWAYLSLQAIIGEVMDANNVKVYINGVAAPISESNQKSYNANIATSQLMLGGYRSTSNTGLPDGSMMKETKIFNTGVAASSADRMYTEMNSSSAYWGNLIGYWKQVETSGSTLTATVGVNGIYGSNVGSTTPRDVSSNYTSAALTNNKFTGTISAEGTTRITANHVGMLGATSETTVDVVIDKTAPTGSMYASTANTNQNSIKIYVDAEDELSGVGGVIVTAWAGSSNWVSTNSEKYATFNADTGLWEVTYNFSEIKNTTTGATNQGQGSYYFGAHIYDKAGNRAIIGTPSVVYDTEGPTGSITLEDNGTYYRAWLTGDDNLSGIASVDFYGWYGGSTGTNVKFIAGTYDSSTGKWYADYAYSDVPHVTSGATNNGGGTYYADCWPLDRAGNNRHISAATITKTFAELAGTVTTDKLVTNSPTIRIYIESTIPYDQMSYINVNGWQGGWWKEYALTQTAQYDSSIGKWYADYTFANLPNTTTNETNNGDSSAYLFDAHLVAKDGQYKIAPGIWVTYDSTSPNAGSYTVSGATKGSDGRYYTTDTAASITLNYTGMSDNLSGLSRFDPYLKKDGATRTKDYNVSHNISDTNGEVKYKLNGEGVYVTEIYLYDNANNLVTCESVTIVADNTPPQITSITYDPGWKNVDIKKYIEASDTVSGVELLEYSYDLNTWYSDWDSSSGGYANKTWTEEGDRVLYFRATDYAGNTWVYAYDGVHPSAYDLKIDKTKPVTGTYTVTGTIVNKDKHYVTSETAEITLNFTGMSDNLSGLKLFDVYMKKDGATRTKDYNVSYSINGSTGEVKYKLNGYGTYVTEIYLYDNAGNLKTCLPALTINAVESLPVPTLMSRDSASSSKHYAIGAYRADSNTTYTADKIKTITLLDLSKTSAPTTYVATWDASYVNGSNDVTAWLVTNAEDSTMYDLYLGATEEIYAPENGNLLFGHYTNCTQINNFAFLNTSRNTSMRGFFYGLGKLESIDLSNFSTENCTNMWDMFNGCKSLTSLNLTSFNTSKLIYATWMFYNCSNLTNIEIGPNFVTDNVTNMSGMFYRCNKLISVDVSNFNTIKVTDMSNMFSDCNNLTTLNVSNFNTSKVTNMMKMFSGCRKLTNIDVSSFNTSNVTRLDSMFYACNQVSNLDVSNFSTSKVKTMAYMFYGCSSLKNLDLRNFDTSSLDGTTYGTFSVAIGVDVNYMFTSCANLESVIFGNNFNKLDGYEMFENCNNLKAIILTKAITSSSEAPTLSGTTTTTNSNGKIVSGPNGLISLTNAILYVPDPESETAYESATNYSTVFGIDRIRPILELIGDSSVSVTNNTTYVDAGVTVAGMTKNADETYTPYEYRVDGPNITKDGEEVYEVNLAIEGTYTLTYLVEDVYGEVLMAVTREVKVTALPMLMERADMNYVIGYNRTGSSADYVSDNIKTITLINLNTTSAPTTYVATWDVSYNEGDNTVTAWLVTNTEDSTMYDLYIGAKGKILAPAYSKSLFAQYKNCTNINNLNLLNTTKATTMQAFFYKMESLQSVDLSEFSTTNCTNMWDMFNNCKSLTSIDISSFNTFNLIYAIWMFYGCSNVTNINLGNMVTANVTNMSGMFYNCNNLVSIDLSSFNTS